MNSQKAVQLHQTLTSAVRALRLGMEGKGNSSLTGFIDALWPEMVELPRNSILQINAVLSETMAAQSRRDFLRVADLLEYEIAPLLN